MGKCKLIGDRKAESGIPLSSEKRHRRVARASMGDP
jgi:hypothetical protein